MLIRKYAKAEFMQAILGNPRFMIKARMQVRLSLSDSINLTYLIPMHRPTLPRCLLEPNITTKIRSMPYGQYSVNKDGEAWSEVSMLLF